MIAVKLVWLEFIEVGYDKYKPVKKKTDVEILDAVFFKSLMKAKMWKESKLSSDDYRVECRKWKRG